MAIRSIGRLALGSLLFFATIDVSAGERTTIGVLRFQASDRVPESITTTVEQFVYSTFASQGRFQVLERSRIDAVQAERAVQGANNVVNPTLLADLGADYVVIGEVSQADVTQQRSNQGGVMHRATVAYGVRILDVRSGAVAYAAEFSNGRGNMLSAAFSGFMGDASTPAGAVDIAIRQTKKAFDAFVVNSFAVAGRIVSIESVNKKGAPATVLVTLGEADGIRKGTKLSAYQSRELTVDGQTLVRKKPLATLSVLESQGEHLTLCKIVRGGDALPGPESLASTKVYVEVLK